MMVMMNNECCNIRIIQDIVGYVMTKKTVSGWVIFLLMTHLGHTKPSSQPDST